MAAGKSSVSVSRWICRKSGGKTLNVLLGRPRAAHRHFDLIVATPQYGLPNSDNVVQCSLPMTRTDARHSPERMPYWQDKWRDLPRPWTAVMIGGGTAQLKFDDASALNLLEQLERYRLQVGGSLLVTTSPRTPPRIAALISTRLPRHSYFHAWQEQAANPYQAFLALADRFVVTIDSVTMIAEAVDRMKPVYYFKLPQRNVSMRLVSPRLLKRLRLRRHRRREEHMVPDLLDRLIDRLAAGGIISSRNDYSSFEADLRHRGVARPLDALMPSVPWPQHNLLRQESQHVAHRIWALWCSAQGQPDC